MSICVCYSPHQSEDLICSLESVIPASHPFLSVYLTTLTLLYNLYVAACSQLCCGLMPFLMHFLFTYLLHFFVKPHPFLFLLSLSVLSPTPKVSWLRKDGEMSESQTIKDMFDRRLRFTNISESDGGEYQCMAENSQGKTTHTYTVTVEGMLHTCTL